MLDFKRESLDGLDESLHALYAQKDGAYFLNVSGVVSEDELTGIKANRDALLAEKKEQQRLAQEAESERLRIEREANEEAARKAGDWQALEDSYKTKLSEKEAEFYEKWLEKNKDQVRDTTTKSKSTVPAKGTTSPKVSSLFA